MTSGMQGKEAVVTAGPLPQTDRIWPVLQNASVFIPCEGTLPMVEGSRPGRDIKHPSDQAVARSPASTSKEMLTVSTTSSKCHIEGDSAPLCDYLAWTEGILGFRERVRPPPSDQ